MIKKIYFLLKLFSKPAKQRVPSGPSRCFSDSVRYVSYDDGWPGHKESEIDAKSPQSHLCGSMHEILLKMRYQSKS